MELIKGYTYYMPESNYLWVKNKYENSYYYQTVNVPILFKTHH